MAMATCYPSTYFHQQGGGVYAKPTRPHLQTYHQNHHHHHHNHHQNQLANGNHNQHHHVQQAPVQPQQVQPQQQQQQQQQVQQQQQQLTMPVDYSVPLHVDCSVEYELPECAKPPQGVKVEPLLMIHPCHFRNLERQRRRPFENNLPQVPAAGKMADSGRCCEYGPCAPDYPQPRYGRAAPPRSHPYLPPPPCGPHPLQRHHHPALIFNV